MMVLKKSHVILICIAVVAYAGFAFVTYRSFRSADEEEMILVEGGSLVTAEPYTQIRKVVSVGSFLLDKDLVTVGEFDAFVKATAYVTEAERFGNAGVFLEENHQWVMVDGATYRYPFGRSLERASPDHPVTQVSWNDAMAFAKWKGKRLPTQWEWELAAKNGTPGDQEYSWGENLVTDGKYKANTWQGSFPFYNTKADGYAATSPVGAFGENDLGFTDMGGNVWQWCSDDIEPTSVEARTDPGMRKVLRGGSFLCDANVCHGYKVTGRSSSTPESSMAHIGFRCAKDL